MVSSKRREETLDPENWDELRALGHKMLDDMMNYLQTIESKPFSFPPEDVIKSICVPLTLEGEGEEETYKAFKEYILPYTSSNNRPRFWGAVAGTGSPYGMLAEMLRAGTNNAIEAMEAAGYVHKQVIEWIKDMLSYPTEAGGVLVSGGSEANYTALAVARNSKAEVDVKARGVQDVPHKMRVYVSDGGHHCLERSVELLGIGNENLVWIPTDDQHKIRLELLERRITEDRAAGCHPFCLIGNAGTVDTGAFDNLNALADIAAREKMWFHIDGAFGGWVRISKTHKHLADGVERADSLAVDLHKWMYMPYGIGCTLVRDRLAHYSTFVYGHEAQYLKAGLDLVKSGGELLTNPHMLALPLSRSFLSLKAYMLLRAYGMKKYSSLIQKNIDQAVYLGELIEGDPELELLAPVASNVVCFRYRPRGLDAAQLDMINKRIADEINKINFWMLSDTTVKGRFSLRAAVTNQRSRRDDFDYIHNLVKELGRKALSELNVK